ncbi:MAG: hypothetical protein GF308_17170 [Candidatus Heimdallarchaeota archaeon]|nr:hypothetical protein [Candidatus Heimdallarchaeota archaeon]
MRISIVSFFYDRNVFKDCTTFLVLYINYIYESDNMSEKKPTIKAPLATLGQRIIAAIIDGIIVNVILFVCYLIPIILAIVAAVAGINWLAILNGFLWFIFSIAGIAAALYYYILWPANHEGQTFGKKFQKTKIMVVEDLQKGKIRPVTPDDKMIMAKRFLFGIVDGLLGGLVGLYFINDDPNNQRFGDKQAGTVVIQDKEK